MNNQKGFTMVELAMSLLVVSILMVFAIPAYQSFVQKSQVREAVKLFQGDKQDIEVFRAETGVFPYFFGETGSPSLYPDWTGGSHVLINPAYSTTNEGPNRMTYVYNLARQQQDGTTPPFNGSTSPWPQIAFVAQIGQGGSVQWGIYCINFNGIEDACPETNNGVSVP